MVQSSGEGRDQRDKPDFEDIKGRLDDLGEKLERVQDKDKPDADPAARGQAMGVAFRLATEMVAGVFVGALLGWALDRWLGTSPFLLIVFLLLGVAAGLLNAVKAAQRMQKNL